MSAKILDGKVLAQKLKDNIKNEVADLKKKTGRVPCIRSIMIGGDHSAAAYEGAQQKSAAYLGFNYSASPLPVDVSLEKVLDLIRKLNDDPAVDGIMLHKPVTAQIDYRRMVNSISPAKDLEGIHVANIGQLMLGSPRIVPCTPAAVMEHIRSTGIKLRGKEAVIIGRSEIVGKPLSLLLLEQSATVTVCHGATSEAGRLIEHVGRADILVAAVGKPELIKGEWIKEGAVVIDVGINRVESSFVGDVEFDSAKERASFITPVPGGVGPVTVIMLMRNGLEAFKMNFKQR